MLASWEKRLQRWVAVPDDAAHGGRQPRLLGYLLLGSMGALLIISLVNVGEWLLTKHDPWAAYLPQDAATWVPFLLLWALYRRGHVRLAGYLYIGAILASSLFFPLPGLNQVMLLYALPVAASSFVIGPLASLVAAALATAAYGIVYVKDSGAVFNSLSILALWLLAAVSWLVSERSERHLAERDSALAHLTLEESRLSSLYDIARYEARDTSDLLKHALDEAIRLTGSSVGYLHLYDEVSRTFEHSTWSNEALRQYAIRDADAVFGLDETGLWGEAIRQRRPIVINDFQTPDPLKKGLPPGHLEIKRFLSVPISANGRIVAVVGVANKQTAYDDDDQRQLSLLTDAVWAALERERSQEALRDSEARYRLLAEHMTDVIWRLDLETFRFKYVSPSVLRMRGFTAQEVMDQPGEASLTPESLALIRQTLNTAFVDPPEDVLTTGSLRVEVAQPRKDGSVVWVEVDATPLYNDQGIPTEFIGVSRDVSARKATQDMLSASEERYRTLFATILEGFALHEIICDDEGHPVDYRFLDINPAFERLTGLVRDNVVGKTVLEVLPATEDYWIQSYGRVALTGEPISFENFSQNLDRQYSVTAFSPRRGQFAVVFSDVTEARRAQDALQAAVAEKDLLLREIHHRVKNNLQVIASLLSLQMDGQNDPALVQAMRDSQNRIRSMALIHTKLYESRDLSNVDFGGFVRDLTRILSHSFGAVARGIAFDVQAGTITLDVDTVIPCSLIINELVTNSLRHAFTPGKPGLISISMQVDENGYVLRVADNGPGLPPDLDIRETRSLGLRLVTMLAEQLSGSISLQPGSGACFVVRFPRHDPRPAAPPTEAS